MFDLFQEIWEFSTFANLKLYLMVFQTKNVHVFNVDPRLFFIYFFMLTVISVRQVETQMKAMDNEMASFEKNILDR